MLAQLFYAIGPYLLLKSRSYPQHISVCSVKINFFDCVIDETRTVQCHSSAKIQIEHMTFLLFSCEYCKVFKNSFSIEDLQKQSLQMFFKIGVLTSFVNFTGKHLCWSLFLKNQQAGAFLLHKKRLQRSCFPVKFAKFLRTPFLTEHLR